MSRDFGVTDGHSLYSLHRYRSDVRHMVIFDDLVEKEHHRVRLYVSASVYEMIRQAETNGLLRIVHHEEIVEGCSEPDSPRRRKLINLLLTIPIPHNFILNLLSDPFSFCPSVCQRNLSIYRNGFCRRKE